ncbi:hypothetical protein FA13DRAFT_1744499, partial [Coprinellus micaceus]
MTLTEPILRVWNDVVVLAPAHQASVYEKSHEFESAALQCNCPVALWVIPCLPFLENGGKNG